MEDSDGVGRAGALVLEGNNYECILFDDGRVLIFYLQMLRRCI
jgi:hypothetical protein